LLYQIDNKLITYFPKLDVAKIRNSNKRLDKNGKEKRF